MVPTIAVSDVLSVRLLLSKFAVITVVSVYFQLLFFGEGWLAPTGTVTGRDAGTVWCPGLD